MEDEVMEQIRTRLAVATSVATALAKSLDALDENTLQTLEFWLAKQEGDSKCGQCRAQMPRGKETSVCIACGSKRPPLPNTPAYDFKVSFAFLQFLETIHPPLKSGSRKIWNPIVSTASVSPEPSASIADLPVESEVAVTSIADLPIGREVAVTSIADMPVECEVAETSIEDMPVEREVVVAIEFAQHSKEDLKIDENIYPINFQESPSDDNNVMIAGEDGREADDFGDFQESWGENAVKSSHEISEDVVKLNGSSHSDQFPTDLEAVYGGMQQIEKEPEVVNAAAANSGAVSSWDTEWDYPPSHFIPAKTQSEDNVSSDNIFENSKDITRAVPQVPEYDLSIFESFGGIETKEENVLPDTDADATFWDFQNKRIVNPRLASVKAMERFASDTSAFTTITDADSDSGDSSLEASLPPKLPIDVLMELGANSGQNNLLGSLISHEPDDFQKVAASSHPLGTMPTSQDPFSWPLDTLDTMTSQVVGGDVQNVESSSATTLERGGKVALDPFPWPLEEFDSGTSTVAHAQGSLDLMDPDRPQSEGNGVDPFSWPLDIFSQVIPGLDKGDANGPISALQAEVNDTAEEESEDWGDEEFLWSQAEPANEAQFTSNADLPFPSGSSPLSTSFSSNTIAGDTFMDKERFFHDQSSPIRSVTNLSAASPANLGNGLESLVTTEGEKTVSEEDFFKSTHVKSLSFGDFDKKVSGLDNIDDLFKRSVAFGNLQVKDMAEGDELLKALQTPSIPQPAPPSEDILNFLNLKPAASSQVTVSHDSGSFTKPSHGWSVSFDTVELVPDEQSDEMFQFFHTRSLSAGSSATKSSAVEDGGTSKDIFDKSPSTPKNPNPAVGDAPFSFIHTAISPSAQPETVEVKAATNADDDDDDGFFEWKSAENAQLRVDI